MDQALVILISCVLSILFSFGIVWFERKKADEMLEVIIRSSGQALIDTIQESIQSQLDPILETNSRAMGIIGSIGAQTKKVQMVERQVQQAIQDDLPISPDMIRSFSPSLADTLEEYPELLPKALQAYQKITGGDLGGQGTRRKHPFGNREE